jgi:hypothetical protein
MNWGYKIVFAYIGFVAIIVAMVVVSMRQKVDLVSKDYYAKELAYQGDINKMNNTAQLQTALSCILVEDAIKINFPQEQADKSIKGEVYLYKPSDASSDVHIPIESLDGVQLISTQSLGKGLWKVKIDWEVEGIGFQEEKVIVIN